MKKTYTYLLLFIWMFIGISMPAHAQTELPYEMGNGGHYLIELEVNNKQSFKFIVDTAAQHTSIYSKAVKALGLRPLKKGTYIRGANGITKAELYSVKSIRVGDHLMKKFNAAVLPELEKPENIGGILGIDFLQDFAVEFDPVHKLIKLHKHGKKLETLKATGVTVPVQREFGGFLFYQIQLNDVSVTVLLDTGARRNVINWTAAKSLGISRDDPRLMTDEPITGAAGETSKPLQKIHIPMITLGNQTWTTQMATVFDIDVFNFIGLGNKPAGIFGAQLLREKRYIIDFKNEQLVFLPM